MVFVMAVLANEYTILATIGISMEFGTAAVDMDLTV